MRPKQHKEEQALPQREGLFFYSILLIIVTSLRLFLTVTVKNNKEPSFCLNESVEHAILLQKHACPRTKR